MRPLLVAIWLEAVHQDQLARAQAPDGSRARLATLRMADVFWPQVVRAFDRW